MAKTRDELLKAVQDKTNPLLADLQAVNREREALRLKARKMLEKIDPLLEEAEAIRRANPTPGAEAQTVG